MSKQQKLINPTTGTTCFGFVPAIHELDTERAPIYLLKGYHVGGGAGQGQGFGEKHILAAHRKEMAAARCKDVAEYVAKHVYAGVPVCHEGGFSSRKRVLAMRHKRAIVVLEYREASRHQEAYWNVVTAYVRGNGLPAAELGSIEAADS